MISKRLKTFLFIISVICLCGWLYVFLFSYRFATIYDQTIQNTTFEEIVLEKDSALSGHLALKNINSDSVSTSTSFSYGNSYKNVTKSDLKNNPSIISSDSVQRIQDKTPILKHQLPQGRSLKASQFPKMYSFNSRVRLATFFKTFQNGDFITGAEISKFYKNDPSLNKLAKATLCSFIEKNIDQVTRVNNSLVITTNQENGIQTKIKIPFVEDLRISIANGSSIEIGETFASKEKAFYKSILMPIKLNSIDILHNGELFPKKGYISGDYYFIDYSQTKMAYKIR